LNAGGDERKAEEEEADYSYESEEEDYAST
jgi:hypothetical protein